MVARLVARKWLTTGNFLLVAWGLTGFFLLVLGLLPPLGSLEQWCASDPPSRGVRLLASHQSRHSTAGLCLSGLDMAHLLNANQRFLRAPPWSGTYIVKSICFPSPQRKFHPALFATRSSSLQPLRNVTNMTKPSAGRLPPKQPVRGMPFPKPSQPSF